MIDRSVSQAVAKNAMPAARYQAALRQQAVVTFVIRTPKAGVALIARHGYRRAGHRWPPGASR